jgi:hypothetical protein
MKNKKKSGPKLASKKRGGQTNASNRNLRDADNGAGDLGRGVGQENLGTISGKVEFTGMPSRKDFFAAIALHALLRDQSQTQQSLELAAAGVCSKHITAMTADAAANLAEALIKRLDAGPEVPKDPEPDQPAPSPSSEAEPSSDPSDS